MRAEPLDAGLIPAAIAKPTNGRRMTGFSFQSASATATRPITTRAATAVRRSFPP